MSALVAERTKRCTGSCGLEKPWSAFYAKEKWPDGTMRRPQSRCMDCMRAAAHAARAARRERMALDPRFELEERIRHAEHCTTWRRAQGVPAGTPRLPRDEARPEWVPIGPWRDWLIEQRDSQFDGVTTELARWLGVVDSMVHTWISKRSRISVESADAVLCHIGEPALLGELWPQLYVFDD